MAKGKVPTERKTITLTKATLTYLERVAARGTHGWDVADVARQFVEEGVRRAIKDNFISLDDAINSPPPKT